MVEAAVEHAMGGAANIKQIMTRAAAAAASVALLHCVDFPQLIFSLN